MNKATYQAICTQALSEGNKGFCVPLALSIVSGTDFSEVNNKMIRAKLRTKKSGAYHHQYIPWAQQPEGLNLELIDVTKAAREAGARTVKSAARILSKGKYLVKVRGHLLAIVDGNVCDWTDGRQHRVQSVHAVVENGQLDLPRSVIRHMPVVDLPTPAPAPAPQPAPAPVAPAPQPKPRDILAPAKALYRELLENWGFNDFQLGLSGKYVKFNTLQGVVYLNPNKSGVRLFVRNEETLDHVTPIMQHAGFGLGTERARYTFWMLSLEELAELKEVL